MMRRTALALALVSAAGALPAAPAHAWEAAGAYMGTSPSYDDMPSRTPQTIKQMGFQSVNGNITSWYFALRVNNSSRTRDLIQIDDPWEWSNMQLIERLTDAYRTGKKVRWLSNYTRPADTGNYAGYSHRRFLVKANDLLDLVLE